MEQLINRLIEADKEARSRVAKAKKERAKALETVDFQRKELESGYQKELETLIEKEQKHALEAKTSALSEIEESKQSLISGLDEQYRKNADVWVRQIVARVLEG